MIGSLYTAISGLKVTNTNLTVIGDNIANVSTPGFKGSQATFANVLNESLASGQGANTPGAGVRLWDITEKWEQGSMENTGLATDLAISGPGLFRVVDTAGTNIYYTRAGRFHFDSVGTLVNPDNLIVQGYAITGGTPAAAASNIVIDPTTYMNVSVGEDGIISAQDRATGVRSDLFQVTLYDFNNLQGLSKKSGNLYTETTASGPPVPANGSASGVNGMGIITPGNLEMSNVDLAEEFSRMIVAQKAFQANAKVITTADEVLTSLINIKR
jgi:flagellar hook protein FlgE